MVKDIMARRTSENEVKESFFFSPIIINDLLAFINFLIRHKIRCWKNIVARVKRLATKKLIFFWLYTVYIYFFVKRFPQISKLVLVVRHW